MGIIGTDLRAFFRTQAQFDVLPATERVNGALYYIYDKGKLLQYNSTTAKFTNYSGSVEIKPERPAEPIEGKMYIIGTTGNYKLEFYLAGVWETISGGSQTSIRLDGGRANEVYQQDDTINGGGA